MKTEYDSSILQAFVDKLYSLARSLITTSAILFGFLGGVGSYIYSTSLYQADNSYIILGIVIGITIGIAYGQHRAFKYKLEAQRLLCQMQIEKNTRN